MSTHGPDEPSDTVRNVGRAAEFDTAMDLTSRQTRTTDGAIRAWENGPLPSAHRENGLSGRRAAMVRAAKDAIETNLDKRDLSPAMVARLLGVSLRTLHRSFAASDDSIMSFARRRRLEEAHDDLIRSGATTGISEIAARWHFSDASHFIRHFKSVYGTTPAAYLRNHSTRSRS
ncbi:helix-turn-helix domain-containing protein [Streptomyces cadmiisoli]|uniref:HTH araC/xylS-type domain-containing protein n=1 Tax=Streptomyces cadmiisoli TaxID=2184053 RepID=A0A2Z4IRY7_9ACTN|nr:helix-turn-helix domain-containing protein [Streptomyces cadmiisoli]AWW35891.1 hypothetical protein DN051_03855 [Streptomyces cadmiisoli]